MTISQISSSTEDFYAVLTSPFLVKKVTINSYTPYNEPTPKEDAVSKSDFPRAKAVNNQKLKLKYDNLGILDFSKRSANIVKEMIQDGYAATNALDTQKAIAAYGLNAIRTAGGVSTISNNAYEI